MKRTAILTLAALLSACQNIPKELPHYPCANTKGGYVKCSVDEWVMQKTLEMNNK